NRTLPKDTTPESITPDEAIALLAAKRDAGPTKRKAAPRARAGAGKSRASSRS
ncbi:MAG: hypothetical protein J0I87_03790, partial [Cellulomonas sp.]|nr:hypothetical protein [Cellulomonas sp.]